MIQIVVPRSLGVPIEDLHTLTGQTAEARQKRWKALTRLDGLIAQGYVTIMYSEQITECGIDQIYTMERIEDQTQLDPISPPKSEMVG